MTTIVNNFVYVIFYQILWLSFAKFILLISPRNAISDLQFALNWGISLHLPTFLNHRGVFVVWSTTHLILEISVLRWLVTYLTVSVLASFQDSSKGVLRIASLFYQVEYILALGSILLDSLNRLNVIYILFRHHLLLSVHSTTSDSSTSFHLYRRLLLIGISSLQIM